MRGRGAGGGDGREGARLPSRVAGKHSTRRKHLLCATPTFRSRSLARLRVADSRCVPVDYLLNESLGNRTRRYKMEIKSVGKTEEILQANHIHWLKLRNLRIVKFILYLISGRFKKYLFSPLRPLVVSTQSRQLPKYDSILISRQYSNCALTIILIFDNGNGNGFLSSGELCRELVACYNLSIVAISFDYYSLFRIFGRLSFLCIEIGSVRNSQRGLNGKVQLIVHHLRQICISLNVFFYFIIFAYTRQRDTCFI